MKKFFFCFCLFFLPFYAQGEELPTTGVESTYSTMSQAEKPKTICLNMIVKNESDVIRRCLSSVKPLIHYWVIVDTGSSDGTQATIKEFLKDIPGELHERPWVNFEHNRNEALALAKNKADYVLIIDADDFLSFSPDFTKPLLDKDFYFLTLKDSGSAYSRIHLVKNSLNWKWTGVLHEYLHSDEAKSSETLQKVINVRTNEGHRSKDPQKFQKDARILEEALQKEPQNSRYVFYLAQSYRDAEKPLLAIQNYEKRTSMHGWDQEAFWSLYQIALLQEKIKMTPEVFLNSYTKAYQFRPSRAEPLYRLANYYRKTENYFAGYLVAQLGLSIPLPKDQLFVEEWIYSYGLLLEFSICASWIERYREAENACKQILRNPDLPPEVRSCTEKNLEWIYLQIL